MDRVVFSPRRLGLIALNTLREAVRQRILNLLVVLALVVVLGAQCFRDFHFGSPELKFIADIGSGATAVFGTVLAVVLMAQLFFSELEHRTALTLLAKPVWRAEFILGKYAGVAVMLGAFCGSLTLVLAGVLWVRETALMRDLPEDFAGGRVINYAHLAAAGMLQWLKLLVLSALTLLAASYARTQLFTMVMGFFVFVICHLQHWALAASARAGATAAGVAMGLVARVLPDFQLFNLTDTMGGGETLGWSSLGRVVLYALAYMAAACGLAVFCFRRREI